MAWTDITHTVYQWFNSPSTSTPLDETHLEAAEQDLWNATQADIDALDAYLEPLITAATPAPNIIAAGNIGTYTPSLGSFLNTWITCTLTSAATVTLTGLGAGSQVVILGSQDGTGGRTLNISNGATNLAVSIPTAPGAPFRVIVYSPDGTNMFIQPPNPTQTLLTATNAAWPIPPGANVLRYTLWGGYGGGGGGAFPSSGTAGIFGGSGGGLPFVVRGLITVGAMTTLAITIASSPAVGGTGGTSGSPSGTSGGNGGDSTITGSGISGTITALGGAHGNGASNTATSATLAGVWGAKAFNGQAQATGSVGMGGPSGTGGSAPWLELGGAGGGGGNSNGTAGGGAGGAGTTFAGGTAGGTGTSGSINGANAANGVTGAGGGGGAGAWNGGTPGNGGNGGTGPTGGCIMEVVG